ncbi:MAG: alkaline phosphatase family protein [Phycisphaerae bacterium]
MAFRSRFAGPFLAASWLLFGLPPAAAGPRVVLISVDGLRPDAITPDVAPALTTLRDGGIAATAFNDLPSATLPNHASMLTGLVGDVHGLVANFDLPGKIRFPTLFDFAAASSLRSAFFASKSKLRYLAPDRALEVLEITGELEPLAESVVNVLRPDGPDLVFVHLREPDSTGHAHGWMSPEYLGAVARSDQQIARIVAAARADTTRDTYFLVTADHGGEGLNHFLNLNVNREIPWIVHGPGIAAGVRLEGAVSIVDTTPTVLWLLGGAIPDGLSGVARTQVRDSTASNPAPARLAPVGIPCLLLAAPPLVVVGGASAWWAAACRPARRSLR